MSLRQLAWLSQRLPLSGLYQGVGNGGHQKFLLLFIAFLSFLCYKISLFLLVSCYFFWKSLILMLYLRRKLET